METTKGLKKRVIGLLLAIIMILQIIIPTLTVFATEGIKEVQFADENLYNKVKKELEGRRDLSILYRDDELTMQIKEEDIIKITELNLKGSEEYDAEKIVRNLKGLESFEGLKVLDLSANFLSSEANLNYLNDLANLTDLDLSENCIEDVSGIPNLTNAAIEGKLKLTLTNQELKEIAIVNKISDSAPDDTLVTVDLPQIFSYAYANGNKIKVNDEEIASAYITVENGIISLHMGHQIPVRTETEVGNVPELTITVSKTEDGENASSFSTECKLKIIVINGEDYEGIIFHEEGNLYKAVKEQIEAVNGKGTNAAGKEYADIISSNNKYFDDEKVMVINKVDLLYDITKLDVSNSGINYLNGIEYFVGLQDLILEYNYIQNTELLKKLIENKEAKAGEIANALSSELEDFNEEYAELDEAYTNYKSAVEERYALLKKQAEGTSLTTAEAIKLNTLSGKIVEYEADIKTYARTSIDCLNIINDYISLDEIIGFSKTIDEIKEQIDLLENSNTNDLNQEIEKEETEEETEEESETKLSEIKNNISTLYEKVASQITNLSREELGYLTDEEYVEYVKFRINELSEERLKEVIHAYNDEIDLDEDKTTLLKIIIEKIDDTDSESEKENAKRIEAIIDVLEIKDKELLNIEYYDDHEILYELRVDLKQKSISELRSFAATYIIDLTDIEDDDVEETIVENLESFSRDKLINILGENALRERYASLDSYYYNQTGSELIGTLSEFASKGSSNNLIGLLSESEVEIYQKFALIDAIMKEVNDYKMVGSSGDYSGDTVVRYFGVETTKTTDEGKTVNLSEQDIKEKIEEELRDYGADKAGIEDLKEKLNDFPVTKRYITSDIDDARLYDMTLDFSYEQTDAEGNTRNISLIDRIVEELNENVKNIEDDKKFGKAETLYAAKELLNIIEPIQNKTRYLQKALSLVDIDELDLNGLETVKLKLDKIKSRLVAENIKNLSKLEVLNLARNMMLVDVSPLSSLTTLRILNLAHDYMIDDIANLKINSFTELESLNLSDTGLTDIEIAGLKKLRCLDLSYNYLKDINNVQIIGNEVNSPYHTDNLRNLIHLNLSGNNIADIENIADELNDLYNYQRSTSIKMALPFDIDRDLMLYCQNLWIDLGVVSNASKHKIIDLPMIYRQIEAIQGITVYFNGDSANPDNIGKQVALPTHELGNFTRVAEIVGGIAAGTKYTINYTVKDKEEVNKIPVTGIMVQEEVFLTDENAKKPDLNGDGKVSTEDLTILKNGIAGFITFTEEQEKLADLVPDGDIDTKDELLLEQIIKASWQNSKLTLEQREKAGKAYVDSDTDVDEEDLKLLALHVLYPTSATGNFNQDINGDEKVDVNDVILLSKYVASKSSERRNTDSVTLSILNTYTEEKNLFVNITPENATDKTVTWVSNNEGIVKIVETDEGEGRAKIEAVGEGTTTINVASNSDANMYKTIRVDVVKAANIVEDINIVEPQEGEKGIKTDYYVGEDLDLSSAKLEVIRRDGSKEIIDITPEMLEGFTTEEIGEKIVTVTFEEQTTTFTINVTEYNEPKVDITIDNLDIKLPENVVYDGQEHLAEVTYKEGVKAGELTVTYKDETENAVEKPVNAGTYKVYAEIADSIYADGKTIEIGTFTIAKAELPAEQRPNIATEYTVEKGGSFGITVENGTLTVPEGITFDEVGTKNITLTFVPSDTNYASIDIPVKVNVVVSVTGVNLDKNEYTIVKGGETHLVATVMPEDSTNKNVTWSSSDETIAKVEDGKVTAVGVGEATITVTTKDGEKSTTCRIIVKEQAYSAKELSDGTVAITGINPETTEEYFRNKFLSENTYKIFKADGTTELTASDTIATGYVLKVYDANGTVTEEQILVVKGDTNGDGKATATDSGAILAHRTGEKALENEYLLAADINNDGTVDGRDSTLLIYHRIGMAGYILQNN